MGVDTRAKGGRQTRTITGSSSFPSYRLSEPAPVLVQSDNSLKVEGFAAGQDNGQFAAVGIGRGDSTRWQSCPNRVLRSAAGQRGTLRG